MPLPLESSIDDTPALHDRAMKDLSFIRRTMEGAASFTDVPGWGLVMTGVTAIAAARVAAAQPSAGGWFATWMLEAVIGATIGGAMMWRKIQQHRRPSGAPILSAPARKFMLSFWPAVAAGAVLTFATLDSEMLRQPSSAVPRILPGLWLLLYGVGVTTAGAHSVRAVPLMGAGLCVIGSVTLLVRGISGNVMLALGFGVWQIACGLWIARRHGG